VQGSPIRKVKAGPISTGPASVFVSKVEASDSSESFTLNWHIICYHITISWPSVSTVLHPPVLFLLQVPNTLIT